MLVSSGTNRNKEQIENEMLGKIPVFEDTDRKMNLAKAHRMLNTCNLHLYMKPIFMTQYTY
jgi:hypothetical protein